MQPGLAAKLDARHDRPVGGGRVHRAALADGIDEGVEADLGQHARTPRRHVAMHVEHDAGGNIVGDDAILGDHPPDLGHRQRGRAGGIGARDHGRDEPGLREMIDATDAVHVAGGDRMQRRQPARMSRRIETLTDCLQHQVGAAETTR